MDKSVIDEAVKKGSFILNMETGELHSAVQHTGSCNLDKVKKFGTVTPENAKKFLDAARNGKPLQPQGDSILVEGCGHCTNASTRIDYTKI